MERVITMSIKELDRSEVLYKLKQKTLTQMQAANILGISTRQIKRLFRAYKKLGAQALISKRRGKPSNHQLPRGMKDLASALIKDHYPDFGPTFACEKLVEVHKIKLSIGTIRSLMITEGLWVDKKIKKKRVFQLRERRPKEGELVQTDGSPHDWFEGRGPKCSLLHCVDDATGKIKAALFAPSEDLWGYFNLMQIYLKAHGRPRALYNDRHAVFKVNKSDALSGNGLTQFGRAMKALDIEIIYANSPQAKGRIERSNRTLQDRLVKELRLNKISTIKEANAFLSVFIEDYNRRFAVVPKDTNNAHRPLLQEQNLDLIFSIHVSRQLSKNLSFQYKNTIYQIRTERETYALRKAKVTLQELEDGSVKVFYKNKPLAFTTYNAQEKQGEVVDAKMLNEVIDNLQKKTEEPQRKYQPPCNHPWKRGARRQLFKVSSF
jgi:predicted XRE-type DNA-binding protein